MLLLKQDNERLQRIVTSKSLVSSQSSLQTHDCIDRRYSTTDVPTERSGEYSRGNSFLRDFDVFCW